MLAVENQLITCRFLLMKLQSGDESWSSINAVKTF